MKKLLLLSCLLIFCTVYTWAQTNPKNDFSFNMVKLTDGRSSKEAPQYGFITGTDDSNSEFYFVMIYPSNMAPLPSLNIKYVMEGIEKDKMKSVRATLIPYDGIVQIGGYRIVAYQAEGRTSIRRQFVQYPNLQNRANHQMYINRTRDENRFIPDIFDRSIELNAKQLDPQKDDIINFRLLEKIPGIIASGYPIVDVYGNLNGLIASPKADEAFDVINIKTIKNKLAVMSNDANLCKYFGMIHEGNTATDCMQPIKDDSVKKALELIKKKRILAQLHDINYPVAISIGGNATGIYSNVGGTVRPGFGYAAGLNIHLFPDSGLFGISLSPKYGNNRYRPHADFSTNTTSSDNQAFQYYTLESATLQQVSLQIMGEFRFNRRLHGQNYIGIGYSKNFTSHGSYVVTTSDASGSTSTHYTLPDIKYNAYILEVGWDMSKMRYSISTSYVPTNPLSSNYSMMINNNVVTPFSGISRTNLYLNFQIAFRLWGYWRNGIKG